MWLHVTLSEVLVLSNNEFVMESSLMLTKWHYRSVVDPTSNKKWVQNSHTLVIL